MSYRHLSSSPLRAIVLAGGAGQRLAAFTRAIHGRDVPKQFAILDGERSLLQRTLDRMAPLIPPEETIVVVGREHMDIARDQTRGYEGLELVAQPDNRETGPGILLPLAHVRRRDPLSRVAIVPSDHDVLRPGPFLSAIARAGIAVANAPESIVLLGVRPEYPETEYGWILPGALVAGGGGEGLRSVLRFVEKPNRVEVEALQQAGAVWNTFVTIGRVDALWRTAGRFLPDHVAAFERYATSIGTAREEIARASLYVGLKSANFSQEVLANAQNLLVMSAPECGWSDWGTPDRVLRSLAGRKPGVDLALGARGALLKASVSGAS